MSQDLLYRKARPRSFDAVVGQRHVVSSIKAAILEDRMPSAVLLEGPFGCGKTTLARLIAAAVNCEFREEGSPDPCGGSHPDCHTCIGVLDGSGSPLQCVIEVDGATARSIDSVRALIDSMTQVVPARYRVYIIDEVHRLTPDAASALLKTAEEPPPGVILIMATTDPDKLLPALRSRALRYHLTSLGDEQMLELLSQVASQHNMEVTESDLNAILARAGGSGRTALTDLEQMHAGGLVSADDDRKRFLRGITDAIADADAAAVVVLLSERLNAGETVSSCHRALVDHFRDALVIGGAPLSVAPSARPASEHAAKRLSASTLLKLTYDLASSARGDLPDARLALEATLLGAVMQASRKALSQAAPAVTSSDLNAFREQVVSDVVSALRPLLESNAHAAMAPVISVTDASSLDDAQREIEEPLPPAPQVKKTAHADDTPPVPFDQDLFRAAITKQSMSRAGRMSVEKADLSVFGEGVVAIAVSPRSRLSDDDWSAAVNAIKGLGWDLEEIILEDAPTA